jgi:Uncharacterized protein conserved in bacteria (DUF2334)
MAVNRLIGPNGNVPILMRDDDINFFTRPNMIETIYSKAWEEGFKVSLSVIPLQKCIDDILVPPEMRKGEGSYSVSENKQLIKFLKSKLETKSVEILQHGFSHRSIQGNRGEFGSNSLSNKAKLKYGRSILRQSLEVEPRFFVPPGDDISKISLQFASNLGMIPIYRKTHFDEFLRSRYIPELMKQIVFKIMTNRYRNRYQRTANSNFGLSFIKPVYVSHDNIGISWSLPSNEYMKLTSFESLLNLTSRIIEACSILRTPVCILNHYHIYFYDWNSSITNLELFRTWHKMLESFADLSFGWKTTFSDLYDRSRKIEKVKIARIGSKITIESNESIKKFSFRTGRRIKPKDNILVDSKTNIVTIEDLLPDSKVVLYEI